MRLQGPRQSNVSFRLSNGAQEPSQQPLQFPLGTMQ